MLTIKEGETIIKELLNYDNTIKVIMKDYELKNKYTIDFDSQLLNYFDSIFNDSDNKNCIVTIYDTSQSFQDIMIVNNVPMNNGDVLASVTTMNIINKMYFKNGYLYIKLFNMNIKYRIRII